MIACASAGLDTSGESVPYIAGWGDGSTETLRAYAAKVDELAGELGRACGIDTGEATSLGAAASLPADAIA
jgi:hypothetical protein